MRGKRYGEEQIISILREGKVAETAAHGIERCFN